MLRRDVQEGNIACLCGSLKKIVYDGVEKIFLEKEKSTVPNVHTSENYNTNSPQPQLDDPIEMDDMEDQVYNIVLNMVKDAQGNNVLMRHLLAGILQVKGNQSRLIVNKLEFCTHCRAYPSSTELTTRADTR